MTNETIRPIATVDAESDRRRFLTITTGAALAAACGFPLFYTRNAWAAGFRNDPGSAKAVTLGFNVPQTGPYADEGADELRAFKLAAKHLNGEGDGGMMKTFKPSASLRLTHQVKFSINLWNMRSRNARSPLSCSF